LHPYLERYWNVILEYNYSKEEARVFLQMVRLKERKLEWAFKQKEKSIKNEDLAFNCGVKVRRFQQLHREYKMTGKIPQLNWNRRPKTYLTDEQKKLIDKALKESKLMNSVAIRLYIKKYYNIILPNNKIHNYLLKKGVSKEDKKKQKQRKYCRYQRDHSFSLGHLDWHDSDYLPGKHVCVLEDDASREIIYGGEFDRELEKYAIEIVKKGIKIAYETYSSVWREMNTDKGAQFYGNKKTNEGEKSYAEFELFLQENNIKHIPSRRNHPQTNGKEERWFRTYEENRHKFKSFNEFIKWYNDRIHLGLSRKEGITPNEMIINKLQPESILGLFFRQIN